MSTHNIIKLLYTILVFDWVIAQQISKLKCDEISAAAQTDPRSLRPHVMQIGYFSSINNIKWRCTGSLISGNFVLANKYCVDHHTDNVRVRKFKLDEEQYSNSQLFSVKALFFYKSNIHFEFGLIQLNAFIPYYESASIYRPACLWTETLYPPSCTYSIINDIDQGTTNISGTIFTSEECNTIGNGLYENANLSYICANASDYQVYVHQSTFETTFRRKNYIIGFYKTTAFFTHCGVGINNFISWIESIVWPECGQRKIKHKPLITYGEPTYHGEYPWHVALYRMEGGRRTYQIYICGGSIINKRTVLTAAHCVKNEQGVLPPNRLIIVAGTNNLIQRNSDAQNYFVRTIKVHEKYNRDYLENDIALLKLSCSIEFSNYVQAICIGNSLNFINMTMGTVAGWGYNEYHQPSEVLHQVSLPVHSNTICRESNRNFFHTYLNDFNYCAGFQNGSNVCSGDSGSAMIFEHNSRWYIKGIVSAGPVLPNSDRCDIIQLVLFTDVPSFYNWIINNLDDN